MDIDIAAYLCAVHCQESSPERKYLVTLYPGQDNKQVIYSVCVCVCLCVCVSVSVSVFVPVSVSVRSSQAVCSLNACVGSNLFEIMSTGS